MVSPTSRSPNTPEWRAVQAIYRTPPVDPQRLVETVARAASFYPAKLAHDPSIQTWLQVLLEWPAGAGATVAIELNTRAEREVLQHGQTSFYTSFARSAAPRVVLKGLDHDRTVRVADFLHELMAASFDYLVERDLNSYLGTPSFLNASALLAFRSAVHAIVKRAPIPVYNHGQPNNVELERLLEAAWLALAIPVLPRS